MGIDAISNAGTETLAEASSRAFGGEGFDLAYEAVGSEAAMGQAISAIDKGGTIVVVGGLREQTGPSTWRESASTSSSMIGSMMYWRGDYETAVEWIAERVGERPSLCTLGTSRWR